MDSYAGSSWIFGDSYDERLFTFPASLRTRRIDGLAILELQTDIAELGSSKRR
jgi:hypothetical protein